MGRYKVHGSYRSVYDGEGGRRTVALDPGSEVELDDAVAEHVLRDAPGVIEPAKKAAEAAKKTASAGKPSRSRRSGK